MSRMKPRNIRRVRNRIEKLSPAQFDMSFYGGHDCDSAACIAGWARAVLHGKPSGTASILTLMADFGLSSREAAFLSHAKYRDDRYLDPAGITRAQAVRVLDHLLVSGEVDWSKRGAP